MVVEWTIAIAIASPRVHRFLLLQEQEMGERGGGGEEEEREDR